MHRILLAAFFLLTFGATGVPAQDLFRSLIGPPRYSSPPPPQLQRPQPQPQVRSAPAKKGVAGKDVKDGKGEPAIPPETPPAYESEMARLAEILGALHYLRPLCGTRDGNRWRNEMSSLVEAEQAPPERRDRMIASFNRSYTAYEQTYRSCTPAAELAIRRYVSEGAKLSRDIATRYGN
jgi:uncharacterized protein (TIGR02301 family)